MPPKAKAKILIADDMVELRSNVRRMLNNAGFVTVIGEAGDGEEALQLSKELNPHIILMDINMPKIDGLKAAEMLAKEQPNVQVIIMSIQSEQEYFRRAMKAGAKDFLTKPFSSSDLIDAIQNVFSRWVTDRPEFQAEQTQAELLTFFSTKGGVGKTTLAANLAVALAKKGKRTLLIDASLQFGDVAITLNQNAAKNIYTLVEKGEFDEDDIERHITKHPSGLKLLLAPSEPAFAEAIKPEHIKKVLEHLTATYQYIIFDTAPHIGAIELSILDQTDLVLLMATLEISSLKNTKLCLKTLSDIKFDTEKLKLVLNKDLPNVGISCQDIAEGLQIPVFATVPMDSETAQRALNQGEPFVVKFPDSTLSLAIQQMVEKIVGSEEQVVDSQKSAFFRIKEMLLGS